MIEIYVSFNTAQEKSFYIMVVDLDTDQDMYWQSNRLQMHVQQIT